LPPRSRKWAPAGDLLGQLSDLRSGLGTDPLDAGGPFDRSRVVGPQEVTNSGRPFDAVWKAAGADRADAVGGLHLSKVIQPSARVTRGEFLARAEALLPMLRERAAETERLRRVPQETIDAFVESGLIRGLQPMRWGGLEVDPATFYEAV